MALITLAGRSHVFGQFFDVLFPYSRKVGLQVCQFSIRQENILVMAISVGRVPRFRAYLLYLSLYEVLEPLGIEYRTKRTGKSRLIKFQRRDGDDANDAGIAI